MKVKQTWSGWTLTQRIIAIVGASAALTTCTTAVVKAGAGTYRHFQTDTEATLARGTIISTHTTDKRAADEQYKNDRIDRHMREIRRLEYDLLDEELSQAKREWILRRIEELKETVACIRADQC